MKWILIHNKWKLEEAKKQFPTIDKNRFLYETNAVDIEAFDLKINTLDARKKLGLPLDKKIIVYTGHLFGWKGVDTLAKSTNKLSNDYLTVFVGGTHKDVKMFKEKYAKQQNILIVGYKRHDEIPLWQKAADILVLPNTAKEAISAYYTSPMKLYEYMASKRLIVASNIPSIKEIIDERSAIFVNPDDEVDLAMKIIESISIDILSYNKLVNNAYNLVCEHTWDKRAERIINFINKR